MPAKPWNFPLYHQCNAGNNHYGAYFNTPFNGMADFVDNGKLTFISAFYVHPGATVSSYGSNYAVHPPNNAYNYIFSFGLPSTTPQFQIRTDYEAASENIRILIGIYDRVGAVAYYKSIWQGTDIPAVEGEIIQLAASFDGSTGLRQIVINGSVIDETTLPTWPAQDFANAGSEWLQVPNYSTVTDSLKYSPKGILFGPMCLLDGVALDLSENSTDYLRIYDSNGDFRWAGDDGALWLSSDGSVKPYYYSECGVPFTQKGTLAQSFTENRWDYAGYPCGTKEDLQYESPAVTLAKTYPNKAFFYDFSKPFSFTCGYLHSQESHPQAWLGALDPNGQLDKFPPLRNGAWGSVGSAAATSEGYDDLSAVSYMRTLCNGATGLSMTMTLDFSLNPTANFGYRKIIGWGRSSGSSVFRVTGPYPAGSNRNIQIAVIPDNSAQFTVAYAVPQNAGLLAFTWQWDNGVFKYWVNGSVISTIDRTSTDTQLSTTDDSEFGIYSYTLSHSGTLLNMCDFVMINSTALTDVQIQNLHGLLIDRAEP